MVANDEGSEISEMIKSNTLNNDLSGCLTRGEMVFFVCLLAMGLHTTKVHAVLFLITTFRDLAVY